MSQKSKFFTRNVLAFLLKLKIYGATGSFSAPISRDNNDIENFYKITF